MHHMRRVRARLPSPCNLARSVSDAGSERSVAPTIRYPG